MRSASSGERAVYSSVICPNFISDASRILAAVNSKVGSLCILTCELLQGHAARMLSWDALVLFAISTPSFQDATVRVVKALNELYDGETKKHGAFSRIHIVADCFAAIAVFDALRQGFVLIYESVMSVQISSAVSC